MKLYKYSLWAVICSTALFTACGGDEEVEMPQDGGLDYTVPTTYEFTNKDGNSTVDYSGQTQRIAMLDEMVVEMKTGNTSGIEVSATVLDNMFANIDSPFLDGDLNTSTKQIRSKTLQPETYDTYIDELAKASQSIVAASNGVAGVVGEKYLVDENGVEHIQLIEKGLFASCFFYQISNIYLSDDRIGSAVNNTDLVEGKNYTLKEHYFDEAFGYFSAPIDFPYSEGSDIAKYSTTVDPVLGTNAKIMQAFLTGRAALVNNDQTTLDAAVAQINEQIELVFAGAAIHYLNGTLANISDDAIRSHELSEAIAFMGGLTISPLAKTSPSELDTWKSTIGTNYWNVSSTSLISVRNEIATKYGISATDRDAL